jgi:hypothetical protein
MSHFSVNDAAAIALGKWQSEQGYEDVFLDIDPNRERGQSCERYSRLQLLANVVRPRTSAGLWPPRNTLISTAVRVALQH